MTDMADFEAAAKADPAPTYVGFRAWRLDQGGGLYPLHVRSDTPWKPLERASCDGGRGAAHPPPSPPADFSCGCGLWAMARPEIVEHNEVRSGGAVIGGIEMGGNVLRATRGYRCGSAAIFGLLMPEDDPEMRDALVRAGRHYGATIVRSMEQLLELSREYGTFPELRDVEIRRTSLSATVRAQVTEEQLQREPPRERVEAFVRELLPQGWRPLQAELVRDTVEEKGEGGLVVARVVRTLTVEVAAVAETDPQKDSLVEGIERVRSPEARVEKLREQPS